ncbi:MAG: hexokinase family protein [Desulfitobacteriaceae bacterium]
MKKLVSEFDISAEQIQDIAWKFLRAIESGLSGENSSLKMLRSFLRPPTGEETGKYLSLDFGGTNVRAALIELCGQSYLRQISYQAQLLADPVTGYDLGSPDVTAEELNAFLAGLIDDVLMISPEGVYGLGYTFSFPCQQLNLDQARLLCWAKGLQTKGVVDQDVGRLLQNALAKRNLQDRVKLKAILNDTVATLLSAKYRDKEVDIGSIIGTGHNTCYLEPLEPLHNEPMIINVEAGNFNGLTLNNYDLRLDHNSENPGEQCLEKMVSGKYIGELFRLIIFDRIEQGLLLNSRDKHFFAEPYSLRGEDLSALLADKTAELSEVAAWLGKYAVGINSTMLESRRILVEIAVLVGSRSARLVAATYLGILLHLDPLVDRKHVIAVDGSLYAKMPGYAAQVNSALKEILGSKAEKITIRANQGGSVVGAAIAAALG